MDLLLYCGVDYGEITIPFWSSIPAITALICAVCIFAFCEYPRRFQNFMVFTATFDGLFILLEAVVSTGITTFYTPTYLLYTTMMLALDNTAFVFFLLEQLFVQKDDCLADTLRYTVTDESGESWDILMTKRQLP